MAGPEPTPNIEPEEGSSCTLIKEETVHGCSSSITVPQIGAPKEMPRQAVNMNFKEDDEVAIEALCMFLLRIIS